MQTRVRFGQLGSAKGQFNSPHGFCLGIDEDIVVADTNNHRIQVSYSLFFFSFCCWTSYNYIDIDAIRTFEQVFDKDGIFKYDFGTAGVEEGHLWYPRKVAVIRQSGKIVVCDRGSERSRMQIFSRTGQFIKRIIIRYASKIILTFHQFSEMLRLKFGLFGRILSLIMLNFNCLMIFELSKKLCLNIS